MCAVALCAGEYKGSITIIGHELRPPNKRPPLSKKAIIGDGLGTSESIADLARYADADIGLVLSSQAIAIKREAAPLDACHRTGGAGEHLSANAE